ncbi:hypothetical protein EB232_23155 [Mesorhizobium sp. NZP2077]|nr:hypothetical protein EB232_23155 [Mesorhizobium sp. NZP2077]
MAWGRPQHRSILRDAEARCGTFDLCVSSRDYPDVGGTHQPDEADILPVARLIIVFLMLGSFALVFAELVRQSEAMSNRPLPTASRCGDATGMPCPQRAL